MTVGIVAADFDSSRECNGAACARRRRHAAQPPDRLGLGRCAIALLERASERHARPAVLCDCADHFELVHFADVDDRLAPIEAKMPGLAISSIPGPASNARRDLRSAY